jgi:ribosomal silencing factor RsfS
MMLEFNNIAVHLFGEESREEIDLEYRLRNPPSKETEEEYEKLIIS